MNIRLKFGDHGMLNAGTIFGVTPYVFKEIKFGFEKFVSIRHNN